MFSWVRRRFLKKVSFFNLEDQLASSFEDESACELKGRHFFMQFFGAPEIEEAKGYSQREQPDLAAEAILEHFQDRIHPIVFLHHTQSDLIRDKLSEDKRLVELLVYKSKKILAHQFSPLGSPAVSFPGTIDWFSDFKNSSWPKAHIKLMLEQFECNAQLAQDISSPIDLTWEFNKHSFFNILGRTYFLTGNENLASEFLIEASDWATTNQVWHGVNWLNPENIASRAINWLTALNLFFGSKQLNPELFVKIWAFLTLHAGVLAWYIRNCEFLSISTVSALYILASSIPELKLSKRWIALSLEALPLAIANEMGNDGFHLSGSVAKHKRATEWLLLPEIFHYMNRSTGPSVFREAAVKAIDVLHNLYTTSGSTADFGAPCGVGFFNTCCGSSEHTRIILALGAVVFQRTDWHYSLNEMPKELFWWLGPNADVEFASISPTVPSYCQHYYKEAGVGSARDHWGEKASFVAVRANGRQDYSKQLQFAPRPIQDRLPVEFHNDFLSMVMSVEDEPLFVEPGRPTYYDMPAFQLSRIGAHTAPRFPGEKEPWPVSFNADVLDGIYCSFLTAEKRPDDALLFRASRQALIRDSKVFITRSWLFRPNSKMLLIRDEVSSELETVDYECNFLLAPHLSPLLRGDMGCMVRGRKMHTRILPIFPARSRQQTRKGSLDPFHGWYLDENKNVVPATQLCYYTKLTVPASTYVVVSWDFKDTNIPNGPAIDKLMEGLPYVKNGTASRYKR